MKWQHCIALQHPFPNAKITHWTQLPKIFVSDTAPGFTKLHRLGSSAPANTLYPSPSRVKWSNAQIVYTQHGIVRKRHFVSNLLWFSTITSQIFHGRRRRPGNAFACQNPLKARAPERPRNDLGGLGKPVETNPWKTAKKKRCIFHIFWGQWVYISYII